MTTTIMAVSHGKKSVMFVEKKVVALMSILKKKNRKQKNFRNKTKNFAEIKANTTHFWLIIKEIQIIILIISIKK